MCSNSSAAKRLAANPNFSKALSIFATLSPSSHATDSGQQLCCFSSWSVATSHLLFGTPKKRKTISRQAAQHHSHLGLWLTVSTPSRATFSPTPGGIPAGRAAMTFSGKPLSSSWLAERANGMAGPSSTRRGICAVPCWWGAASRIAGAGQRAARTFYWKASFSQSNIRPSPGPPRPTFPGCGAFHLIVPVPRKHFARGRKALQARVGEAGLDLVFAAAVFVGDVAVLVGFEEDDLADALADVDAQGEVGEVAELDDEAPRPAGFERRRVEHQPGARVGRFAHADARDVAGQAEGLDRDAEGVGVRRQEVVTGAVLGLAQRRLDERAVVEVLRVDLAAVDGREDAEAVVGESHVVAVGGGARRDDAAARGLAHEGGVEGLDELLLLGHAPNPAV